LVRLQARIERTAIANHLTGGHGISPLTTDSLPEMRRSHRLWSVTVSPWTGSGDAVQIPDSTALKPANVSVEALRVREVDTWLSVTQPE
jgi:hypothetical protein